MAENCKHKMILRELSDVVWVSLAGIFKHTWRLFFVVALLSILYQQSVRSNSAVLTPPLSTEVLAPRVRDRCDNPPEAKDLPKLKALFVGRESNMSHLERRLLSDSVHVLGINGPPGFGKSTLAIHLGWKMVEDCFTVGYIDLEGQHEILSYVVAAFNERRLEAWRPPMELTAEGFEEKTFFTKYGLEWFNNDKALLILDNCNQVLNNDKQRKQVFGGYDWW